ncbi:MULTISPECIES: DUF3883 domain-containing protein [unclassified Acidovorax]|uniref:DUF3883 domain-containing protein n=1 Tax=unclassified Acidovorax TaxID=2684926 RepID=UPI001C44576C|nr:MULTISPECIES: DUF3883 domain-containing protein [unclassified Acidovorax]MBV7429838.1 DUF3883 domain-containing protein [Acidovorax sp. sif0732]MBV7448916.1 DUF3883 domain-containing protein [Acidovorax sp. sif0715]
MEWSREEVEAIVADYLHMLTLELAGQSYSKTAHRRALQSKINSRSDGSIEFKHGNISAAMLALGFPYIRGYQPRSNFQALLLAVLEEQIGVNPSLDQAALVAVQLPAVVPLQSDFSHVKAQAPTRQHRVTETQTPPTFASVKRDYLEREARNHSLGLAGEEFVIQYEHWRLNLLGEPKLADRVEHVSRTKGDGLGFDVLSYETDGRERFVEVKTTTFGKDTPFFVSRGELALSSHAKDQFHLYRLFEFRKMPRLFALVGALEQHCSLDPITFRASFN